MKGLYISVLIITSLIAVSCKRFDTSEIQGKWFAFIDDEYYELWFYPVLVLDFNPHNNLPNKMRYKLDGKKIVFFQVHDDTTYYAYTYKIVNLNEGELEVVIPNSNRRYFYRKVDNSLDDQFIDNDIEKFYNEYYNRR